ncbi:MAG: glycine zipper domain-containing protein [Candidatus Neptunochlamydia sp.]|nr:glycine zipper domain-containing protein [Candidatus Neptunochlamydia sp.]
MLKKSSILVLALGVMLIAGCESNTGTGVLVGGVSGAAIGSIAGGGTGALIGSAAGVIAGGFIGAYLDNQESKNLKEHSPQTYRRVDNGEKLSVNDIINLSRSNVADDKIIGLIQKTNSHYTLNSYQVDKLRDAEVSKRVINYMIYNT